MTTKELCDSCGKMSEITHEFFFKRDSMIDSKVWKFCYECGLKLEKIIEEGFS
jgi:hypothetical protein